MARTLIIAEAGVNHNGDLEKAFELVDVAAAAGADVVKFQSFRADKLATKTSPKADYQIKNSDQGAEESQYDMLKRLELSDAAHEKLITYCKEKNIEFLSTPFDVDGLHMLADQFGLQTIKLGSSELTNGPILHAAACSGRKIILSSGMGSLEDIREALGVMAFGYLNPDKKPTRSDFLKALKEPEALEALKKHVTLLHCTTAYPTPHEDANLNAMRTISEEFGVPVGYSDHTMGIEVSVAAVAMGATVIEKHFTLDRNLPGPDHKASLEPDELKALVSEIRALEAQRAAGSSAKADEYLARPSIRSAMGNGTKVPAPSEIEVAKMARKSLVAARPIAAGEVFSEENLTIKRPSQGASPMAYWDYLGKPAEKAYAPDDLIAA